MRDYRVRVGIRQESRGDGFVQAPTPEQALSRALADATRGKWLYTLRDTSLPYGVELEERDDPGASQDASGLFLSGCELPDEFRDPLAVAMQVCRVLLASRSEGERHDPAYVCADPVLLERALMLARVATEGVR